MPQNYWLGDHERRDHCYSFGLRDQGNATAATDIFDEVYSSLGMMGYRLSCARHGVPTIVSLDRPLSEDDIEKLPKFLIKEDDGRGLDCPDA